MQGAEAFSPPLPCVTVLFCLLHGRPAVRCRCQVEVLEYPELGMEAVWKIQVRTGAGRGEGGTGDPPANIMPRCCDGLGYRLGV